MAEINAALEGNTRCEQTRRDSARLQNHHLPITEQSMIEQHLRNLRRFSRAGRRLDDGPRISAQCLDDLRLEFEDRKLATIGCRHMRCR